MDPHLVDDNSGVGTQVVARDLNGDRRPDIIVGNKRGVVVVTQQKGGGVGRRRRGAAERSGGDAGIGAERHFAACDAFDALPGHQYQDDVRRLHA